MSKKLIPIANNCRLPTGVSSSSSWVNNCWTKHKVGAGGLSSLICIFINGTVSTNSENNASYDFTLKAGLYYKGTFYPLTFQGNSTISVAHTWGQAVTDEFAILMDPGDTFYITNLRVANDGGVAGTYNLIATTGGQTVRQDGIINGTDNTQDYTAGVGVAYGAKCLPTPVITDASGAVASVAIDPANVGTGYTSGLGLTFWYGPAGTNQPGAQHPGTGASGYGNASAGGLGSVSVTGGGSLHRSINPVQCYVGGVGTAASGFGSPTQAYGPSVILGRPRYRVPGCLIIGDSSSAYGSADTVGDINANYCFYEQALAQRGIGNFNFSVSGESSSGWNGNSTNQQALVNYIRNTLGGTIDNVIINLSINDFNSNNNSNVIAATQAQIASIVALARSWGAKAFVTTCLPGTTSTDSWVTLANQTVTLVGGASTNYASGGRVEQYNTALTNRSFNTDGVIDISSSVRATGSNSGKFRVDAFRGGNAFTGDGVHPNPGCGIPFLLKTVPFPTFYVS